MNIGISTILKLNRLHSISKLKIYYRSFFPFTFPLFPQLNQGLWDLCNSSNGETGENVGGYTKQNDLQ